MYTFCVQELVLLNRIFYTSLFPGQCAVLDGSEQQHLELPFFIVSEYISLELYKQIHIHASYSSKSSLPLMKQGGCNGNERKNWGY